MKRSPKREETTRRRQGPKLKRLPFQRRKARQTPKALLPEPDPKALLESASGRWEEIVRALSPGLAGALQAGPGRHVACPVHGGKDGFRIFADFALTGGGICNTCGAMPDGIALIAWANAWTRKRAFAEVARYLEGGAARAISGPLPKRAGKAGGAPFWERLWEEALPVGGRGRGALKALKYLRRRGITVTGSESGDLRFHPALPYFEEGKALFKGPALLGLVRDASGEPAALSRTYLLPDGSGKADVPSPRKTLLIRPEPMTGGAIRLFPLVGGRLGVAEGIETALAARLLTGVPCWSCVSASNLRAFEPPEGIREVLIFADKDRSGTGAGAACGLAKRLSQKGISVKTLFPKGELTDGEKSLDFNDELLRIS